MQVGDTIDLCALFLHYSNASRYCCITSSSSSFFFCPSSVLSRARVAHAVGCKSYFRSLPIVLCPVIVFISGECVSVSSWSFHPLSVALSEKMCISSVFVGCVSVCVYERCYIKSSYKVVNRIGY